MKRSDLYNYRGKFVRAIDGDTIVADVDIGFVTWKLGQHLRLYGINTPEIKGETKIAGEESKKFLMSVLKEDFYFKSVGFDAFGRILAIIYLPESEQSVNDLMIEKKLAVKFIV